MEVTNNAKLRIFFRTLFFAVIYLAIGASIGYWYAVSETATIFLSEANK